MRGLSFSEINSVAGGETVDKVDNFQVFWSNFAMGSGITAGIVAGPEIAIAAGIYCLGYYGIYTPIYYATYGVYLGVSGVASCVSSVFSAGYEAIAWQEGY